MRTLLASRLGHIKGYGIYSDITENTVYGIERDIILQYSSIETEFIVDHRLHPHIVNLPDVPYKEIPRGTLNVYGINKLGKAIGEICEL